ncbi:MAG: ribosome biogenesis GTP-binding protein YihA/YsxC [Limnobacter sp.]|uniref:ribosome biogenesis GTP-binding protein YihA/YsxC n=1 Tax=Limnobacter sp. TaxID=2003368 RepID=UPI00391D14B6
MTINFHNTHFEISASKMAECPGASVPEIVFAGRSNAGKSTAINTLCKQRQLAYASKMPGRTQLLNFFHILKEGEPFARLVDLPGYGFAQLAQSSQSHWDRELGSFLAQRISLRGCVLIVDARRGLLELDHALLDWLTPRQLPVHILLSKADKFNRQEQTQALRTARQAVQARVDKGQPITIQMWSALKKQGLPELETCLNQWIFPEEPGPTTDSGTAS